MYHKILFTPCIRESHYLEEKLYNHAVLNEIYKLVKPGGLGISSKQFEQVISEIYSLKTETEKQKKAVRDTASRLRSWFFFAGLLEKNIQGVITRPASIGKHKAKRSECKKDSPSSNYEEEPPLYKLLNINK